MILKICKSIGVPRFPIEQVMNTQGIIAPSFSGNIP
jgi:hypothetical protein